jgi:hypothetical protein
MDTRSTFVSDGEAAKAVEPRQRAFDGPARTAKAAAVGRPAFGEHGHDAARPQAPPVGLRIVGAIALHGARPTPRPARSPANRGDRIDQGQQLRHIVPVRRREARDERNPVGVGENMMLRPGFAAIGRVRSSFFPPRSARRDALSTSARSRSRRPRRRSSVSRHRWSRCQTPARCHRAKRRQQALPDPQPISLGNMFHGMPLRSTNRIPVSAARSGMGLRPAYRRFRGRRFGSRGSMRCHNSSSIKVMRDRLAGHATVPSAVSKYKRGAI